MFAAVHAKPHARRRPISTLGSSPDGNVAAGTNFNSTYRLTYATAVSSVRDIQVVLGGWFMAIPSGGETNATSTITYKLAIEYSGAFYPIFFSGGARTVAVSPGQTVVSLPTAVNIPASTTFYVRIQGQISGVGNLIATEVIPTNTFTAGDSVDATGVLASSNALNPAGPLAVLGFMNNPTRRTIAVVGDSIAEGYYTGHIYYASQAGQGDTVVNRGFPRSSLGANFANVCIACPGELVNKFVSGAGGGAMRLNLLSIAQCDYAISSYGLNDVYNARTAIQTETDLVTSWNLLGPVCPMGIYQCTLTPRTTSTDAWATTVNQTINGAAGNTQRILVNNWIRDGSPLDPGTLLPVAVGTPGALRNGVSPHPLKGYFEVADLAESARDSGIWKAGTQTTDGVHPNATGVTTLTPAINTGLFV